MIRKSAGAILGLLLAATTQAQPIQTEYVSSFANSHHPQVAYWFFTDKMRSQQAYRGKIDSFAAGSRYTLIYLTQRDGCDFYDIKTMHPIFKDLVAYAHRKGLQVGLQIWKDDRGVLPENTDRLIQEGERQLDANGRLLYTVQAKGARNMNTLLKSGLYRVYAFKKTGNGFYDPATLKDITAKAGCQPGVQELGVSINAGAGMAGYTAYILTQHDYHSCSNFSAQAKSIILDAFRAYADIPFDAIGLDEYKNMTIVRSKVLDSTKETFTERLFSAGMAKRLQAVTGETPERVLLDMRYAPEGKPAVRIKAINEYMALLRTATLGVESAIYDLGKQLYGAKTFIGLHSTFHNNLDGDEVWQTGIGWWNIKRDYGHTDENTPTPIQLGIGMSYRQNAMYNMYYDKSLEKIWTKALYDLRFGVRTHYHAANDVDGWGVSIDAPAALEKINPVENAARLLNRFNPSFPNIKLLVIYGMEALCNWYPDTAARGRYGMNNQLGFESKAVQLWQHGYLNACVPTDLIADGRLKLNAAGKPVLNGHVFDAIVFLAPQYARKSTTMFIQNYIAHGGKLLIDGEATRDFFGNDISATWKAIAAKAVATAFSLDNIARLGVPQNKLVDGVPNEDGSFTFTSIESLKTNEPAVCSFSYGGNTYSGYYKGVAVIKLDNKGNLQKLAATGFSKLEKNGKPIVRLDNAADIFLTTEGGAIKATIADESKTNKLHRDEQ